MAILSKERQQEIKNRTHHFLIDGHVIQLDDGTKIRWCTKNETFEDGDFDVTPLETAFYVNMPANNRWLHYGQFDVISELILDPVLADDDRMVAEGWYIGLIAGIVLTGMNRK